MRKWRIVAAVLVLTGLLGSEVLAASVQGYTRKDGTYVQPYQRTNPDGNPYNNYGFPGNYNPNTGRTTPGDQELYLDRYYGHGDKPRTTAQTPSQATSSPSQAAPCPSQATPSPSTAAIKPQRIAEGLVTHVADGDTVTVITANQTKLRIRMFGIDAPETPKGTQFPGQPYSKEAEAYLRHLVEGKRVKVEIYQVDRYNRLLSTILLDGKDINFAMIKAGLSEVYRGPESGNPYKLQYQAAEDTARSTKKGMWILGDKYESPRDYRRHVGISEGNLASPTVPSRRFGASLP